MNPNGTLMDPKDSNPLHAEFKNGFFHTGVWHFYYAWCDPGDHGKYKVINDDKFQISRNNGKWIPSGYLSLNWDPKYVSMDKSVIQWKVTQKAIDGSKDTRVLRFNTTIEQANSANYYDRDDRIWHQWSMGHQEDTKNPKFDRVTADNINFFFDSQDFDPSDPIPFHPLDL